MKQNEWNPEDWQGRSKKQVESNYRIMETVMMIAGFSFIGWAIYQVFANII